jgi:hypothetical protein
MRSAGGHGLETVLAAEPPVALPAALAARFDAWLAGAVARSAPLSFSELRRGVQALSQRYVERRAPEDALGSPAKRAAFATYYAGLHFLTAHGVARALPAETFAGVTRILDLGAGSGAAGAGVACALETPLALLALERSGFAVAEARHTFRAFSLRGEARRAALPRQLAPLRRGDLALAGWFLNELPADAREEMQGSLVAGIAAGAKLLVLEPLAGRIVPWWDALAAALRPLGIASGSVRWHCERPEWIASMDKAAHFDHRELGARVLAGPL